jgi:hypothetical protein
MRRAKYLLFLLVLTAAVFGLAAVASAAVFSDTKGTKYQTPVDALSQLGIVTGYPDGTIKPDQTITRAEFCAIAVRELGLSSDVAPMGTRFSDVDATHWAGGLINVAVGQGLVKGYPDGTFKPDNPVTYAEAITILVRMLGYGPAMDESTWPAPYLAKAAELGVTANVSVKPSDPAPRGDVFMMAYNSLDAKVMKQTYWGTEIRFEESDLYKDTILKSKLGIDRYGDKDYPVLVEATRYVDTGLAKDEIRWQAARDVPSNRPKAGDDGQYYGGKTKKVVAGIDPNAYLGLEVEVWLNSKGDVVFIRNWTDDRNVFNDVVDEVTSAGKFKLKNKNKEYELADDVVTYFNGTARNKAQTLAYMVDRSRSGDAWLNAALQGGPTSINQFVGRSVKVVLNDSGKIRYMEAWSGHAGVVSKVLPADKTIKYYWTTESEKTLDLSDNDDYLLFRDGKLATLEDVQPGDVINVFPSWDDPDHVTRILVSSRKVTGTVDGIRSAGNHVCDYYVSVGGKEYAVMGNVTEDDYYLPTYVTVSFDNNETIDLVEEEDLDDLLGQQVTLYLNTAGQIRHIVAGEKGVSKDIYAFVMAADYDVRDGAWVKVLRGDGDEVTYYGTDDTKYTFADGTSGRGDDANIKKTSNSKLQQLKAKVVKINLDSVGKLDKVEVLQPYNSTYSTASNWGYKIRVDVDERRVAADRWFTLKDNAVFFTALSAANTVTVDGIEYRAFDPDAIDDTSWKNIQDTYDKSPYMRGVLFLDDKNKDVQVVIVTGVKKDVTVSSGDMYGIITNRSKVTNAYEFRVIRNGQEETYVTKSENVVATNGSFSGSNVGTQGTSMVWLSRGDIVKFTVNSAGRIDDIRELVPGVYNRVGLASTAGSVYNPDTGSVVSWVYTKDSSGNYTVRTDLKAGSYIVTDVDAKGKAIEVAPMNAATRKAVTDFSLDGVNKFSACTVRLILSDKTDPDDKSYVFDYSGTTPKLMNLADLSENYEVQIFWFTGDPDLEGMIQFVKLLKK